MTVIVTSPKILIHLTTLLYPHGIFTKPIITSFWKVIYRVMNRVTQTGAIKNNTIPKW